MNAKMIIPVLVAFFSILMWDTTVCATSLSSVSLHLKVDTESQSLQGKALLVFATDGKEPVSFVMNKFLSVQEVILDEATPIVPNLGSGTITFPPLPPGSHTVSIWYRGIFPKDQARSTGILIRPDYISLSDNACWHPTIPFQVLSISLGLDSPANLQAISTGRLIAKKIVEGREISSWEMDRQRTCAIVVAGNFQRFSKEFSGIPVTLSLLGTADADGPNLLDRIGSVVTCLKKEFGDWPFPTLEIVEDPSMPRKNGRGMNGMVRLATDAVDLIIAKPEGCGSGFIAHEISHNYWGSLVAGNIYQTWLDFVIFTEGFAQFSALLYLGNANQEAFDRFLQKRLVVDWNDWPPPSPTPLGKADIKFPKMSLIAKCGIFLYRLRQQAGSDRFDLGVRRFLKKHSWGLVTLPDFLEFIAQPNDEGMKTFIQRWMESTDLLPAGESLPNP